MDQVNNFCFFFLSYFFFAGGVKAEAETSGKLCLRTMEDNKKTNYTHSSIVRQHWFFSSSIWSSSAERSAKSSSRARLSEASVIEISSVLEQRKVIFE